ncbi:MAG: hypothetical protein A2X61_06290 [Ignavibacteria bacterium GWB2_35_12]|nr:MAG: hypothetical protein A2X63_00100 [Ignavibacteria bacterium GWA2_35_8]OGU37855.1 MAG: hypothetical protein A2X61_06290 [Ignavibacteria bacterium GWB2_35_12]OGU97018.1 MAG: hypothetical protein A2220_11265 [Ignavibacteria bacterium RIFOXYA2_FULL_35_10]OGV18853.1 MAG: hypothetical protein A2475_11185 [Ignavibacteria bacterium RIFOXYC2_FULL_35_21]
MEAVVKKWGNSLGVRIPKPFTEKLKINNNTVINIDISDDSIIIKPQKEKKYSLRKLVEGINSKNIHKEIDTGKPVGREVW